MVEETNEAIFMPPTAMKTNINGRKQLWITIAVISTIIIIAVVVIPTSIILTRKTDTTIIPTTALHLTTSASVIPTTIAVITTEMKAVTTSTPTTAETMAATMITVTTTEMTALTTSTPPPPPTTTTTTRTPILATSPTATQIFNRTTEKVYAIWNTTAGGDSKPSPPGDFTGTYWPTEPPEAALDGNVTSEYTNHGGCDSGPGNSVECGSNTGFYLTLAVRRFTLVSFRIATNVGAIPRDPLMITIEGSNYNESELTFGKSWTLIYNGTTGLTRYFARAYFGDLQSVSGHSMPFTSYRLLVTSKRGQSNCVSYSEFRMMGFIEYD